MRNRGWTGPRIGSGKGTNSILWQTSLQTGWWEIDPRIPKQMFFLLWQSFLKSWRPLRYFPPSFFVSFNPDFKTFPICIPSVSMALQVLICCIPTASMARRKRFLAKSNHWEKSLDVNHWKGKKRKCSITCDFFSPIYFWCKIIKGFFPNKVVQ